jgi:hypothetical protein
MLHLYLDLYKVLFPENTSEIAATHIRAVFGVIKCLNLKCLF